MKVVITGGTGMVGINLIKYLLEKNVEILVLVRNKTKLEKIFPNQSKLKIIECSLNDLEKLQLEKEGYDVFYHLAWEGTRGEDRNNVEMQMRNIKYTIKAVELAKRIGSKRFVGIRLTSRIWKYRRQGSS